MNDIFDKIRNASLELQDAIELIANTDGFYTCQRQTLAVYNKLETCALILDTATDMITGCVLTEALERKIA